MCGKVFSGCKVQYALYNHWHKYFLKNKISNFNKNYLSGSLKKTGTVKCALTYILED